MTVIDQPHTSESITSGDAINGDQSTAVGPLDADQHSRNEARRLRRQRLQSQIFGALSIIFLIIGFAIISAPFIMRAINQHEQNATVQQTQSTVDGWPYPQAKEKLAAARAYNDKLAAGGQTTIGEVKDPFTTNSGQSTASDADVSAATKDTEYQSLLDAGNGVMGSVRIPKIDVNLPIYHGTSDDALAVGAGHLYGTSLPVGGASTHAVLTGHRGLPGSLLFTRLDELKVGDSFYVDVMGEELGYKVDRITVIEPDDASSLRVTPGEDRVTLMTCTPYGVNSHRLLVSGVRAEIPNEVPSPDDVHAINTTVLALVTIAVFLVLIIAGAVLSGQGRFVVMRHSTRQRVGAGAGAGAGSGVAGAEAPVADADSPDDTDADMPKASDADASETSDTDAPDADAPDDGDSHPAPPSGELSSVSETEGATRVLSS